MSDSPKFDSLLRSLFPPFLTLTSGTRFDGDAEVRKQFRFKNFQEWVFCSWGQNCHVPPPPPTEPKLRIRTWSRPFADESFCCRPCMQSLSLTVYRRLVSLYLCFRRSYLAGLFFGRNSTIQGTVASDRCRRTWVSIVDREEDPISCCFEQKVPFSTALQESMPPVDT